MIAGQIEGFVRVAAAVPPVRVTDFEFNREQTLALWRQADDEGVAAVFFPGAGALGLHRRRPAHGPARTSCQQRGNRWPGCSPGAEGLRPLAFVGCRSSSTRASTTAPSRSRAAACSASSRRPTCRPTASSTTAPVPRGRPPARARRSSWLGRRSPSAWTCCSRPPTSPELIVGAEICEDGWVHLPPSAFLVCAGATVIGNLSGSPFELGHGETRHQVCWRASGPGMCAYVYAAAGPGESSSDVAFNSHAMIYENGQRLAESERFSRQAQLVVADVDLEGCSTPGLVRHVRRQRPAPDGAAAPRPVRGPPPRRLVAAAPPARPPSLRAQGHRHPGDALLGGVRDPDQRPAHADGALRQYPPRARPLRRPGQHPGRPRRARTPSISWGTPARTCSASPCPAWAPRSTPAPPHASWPGPSARRSRRRTSVRSATSSCATSAIRPPRATPAG